MTRSIILLLASVALSSGRNLRQAVPQPCNTPAPAYEEVQADATQDAYAGDVVAPTPAPVVALADATETAYEEVQADATADDYAGDVVAPTPAPVTETAYEEVQADAVQADATEELDCDTPTPEPIEDVAADYAETPCPTPAPVYEEPEVVAADATENAYEETDAPTPAPVYEEVAADTAEDAYPVEEVAADTTTTEDTYPVEEVTAADTTTTEDAYPVTTPDYEATAANPTEDAYNPVDVGANEPAHNAC